MPRQSAEARAAGAFQAGGAPPPPPKHLSKEAAAVWRDIVASKPLDWFDAGAQILLEAYCESAVHHRALTRKITALRRGRGAELFAEIVGFATWLTFADSDKLAAWCDRHAEYEKSNKGGSWTASDRSDHRAAASELGLS